MDVLYILLFIVISIVAVLKYVFSHWKRHNVPSLEPVIPFGNMQDFAKQKSSFGVAVASLYDITTEPFIGIYTFVRPGILIRDPELAKRVLVTDFDHFHDRGAYSNPQREPISGNLFAIKGPEWRNKLSPLFSSGKLKGMFPTFHHEADVLDQFISKHNGEVLDMKDVLLRYALNVIGSVFFGIDVNTIDNPEHEFKQIHTKISRPNFIQNMRGAINFLAPGLVDSFKLEPFPKPIKDFFMTIVRQTIEYREKNDVRRNDFMQQVIDMVKADSSSNTMSMDDMTIGTIAGNAFLFFIAGTETSSGTAGYCLHELSRAPKILAKLVEEIDRVLGDNGGEITYDSIQEMQYLDLVIKETLRKYPGLPILQRECTKDYQIPESKITIKKGTSIIISVLGMHKDPNHFSDPEEFIPERFEKGTESYTSSAYLPFGDGPHVCIAVRMGFIVAKLAIIKILSKYRIEAVNNNRMEFASHGVALMPKDGIKLRISLRR